MNYCKLTNQNLQTHNGCQWIVGEWKETSGEGTLCTNGWLHCYTHPLLAAFLNRIHANITNPKLFEIEVAGETKEDCGLKIGFTKMRLIKEIPLPQVIDVQRIAFGTLCAKEIIIDEDWNKWADNWLNGTDRTYESARKAYYGLVDKLGKRVSLMSIYSVYASINFCFAYTHAADAVAYAAECKPINLIELAQKAITFN